MDFHDNSFLPFFHATQESLDMSRVCLVTGASRGIGRSIAQQLAAKGATVVVNYARNEAAAVETLNSLETRGSSLKHSVVQADVSDAAECKRLVELVVQQHGRLDVLVNNAGICKDHDVLGVSYEEWQQTVKETMDANFTGSANLSYLAVQQFVAQDARDGTTRGGRIVNITSISAYDGELPAPSYASSKAALNIFGQSLARRLAQQRILVFSVAPGWVDTDMAYEAVYGPGGAALIATHPLGRVARVDEVGKQVVHFSLDAPEAMTGSVVDLNGASYLR